MFTGLVEAVGTVAQAAGEAPRRLVLATPLPVGEVAVGDSVALDGCCLTVVAGDAAAGTLTFEAATETLRRTTMGRLRPGDRVHMERAMRLSDRLGGHLVAGHVDALGHVVAREQRGSALYLEVQAPPAVMRLTAAQGAVTLAGVSLTVVAVHDDRFSVALIPHTLAVTALGERAVGDAINVEADLLARYVARLLQAGHGSAAEGAPALAPAPASAPAPEPAGAGAGRR